MEIQWTPQQEHWLPSPVDEDSQDDALDTQFQIQQHGCFYTHQWLLKNPWFQPALLPWEQADFPVEE